MHTSIKKAFSLINILGRLLIPTYRQAKVFQLKKEKLALKISQKRV